MISPCLDTDQAITSDPLYKWRISPEVARLKQRDSDEERSVSVGSTEDKSGSPDNETAAAAIQKVKEKLSGYEDGTSGEQQSTRGQVQYLISAARDHDNLCNMFAGWAPWL
jgi:serine-protein kinase ATM